MRHFDSGGARERDYAEQCGPDQGEDCGGSGQRANDTSRGRSAGAEGNHAAAGHSGECGRRDGELLRMGAGFAELLLVGSGSERETGIGDAARVCGSARKRAETSDAHANRGILPGCGTRGGCDAGARVVPVEILARCQDSQALRFSCKSQRRKSPTPLKGSARLVSHSVYTNGPPTRSNALSSSKANLVENHRGNVANFCRSQKPCPSFG